ncbi:TRAP-type C4-dicarboxylate transport system permease small subunit [Cricetibacter osteomyelitidis]|uniref:TRAP transporter small permease protein n=1 Tax=Cricetibacter osteomyelitidis TaxID=1521931 RepID=A0A4R2T5Y4_9PAST|nr:TRAP transporter small permease [Cricetibacter osteomyelitidis]TCP96264.1 TRAP-type C4-dicarboxylate transport system permease small subunit [Cricetibacter osteomyelitidis]
MKSFAMFVSKALNVAIVLILSVMSCLVFINVVLRYGFNSSISMTEELSRYLFVWLAFLGAIVAFGENQHVSVTMLTDRLSKYKRKVLYVFTDIAMLFCCYLIVSGSYTQFLLNINNLAPISGIPLGVNYLASVIAGVLIGIIIIARIISTLGLLVKGERE